MATLYVKAAGGNSNAAGTWSNVSSLGVDDSGPPGAGDDCIVDLNSGQLTINAALSCKTFSSTDGVGDYASTLTHNGFVWTIAGSCSFVSGMTYTPLATSTITFSASGTLTTAGKLLPLLIMNTGITVTLGDNLSFMASKVITLTLNGNSLDINGKIVAGNSAINRVLIRSNTLGTPRTITTTSGTFNAADFRDITASSAIDLSGVSNYSGDCGGNTSITFTTAATQTFSGTTSASWSTNAWTSRVPLPQDNVVISSAFSGGQTITGDMPRLGKSIAWTGSTGSPTFAVSASGGVTNYGSLTLISAMTFTTSVTWNFQGRGSFTLTSAGKSFVTDVTIAMVGGTLTLQDALSITGVTSFTLTTGTLNANSFNVTAPYNTLSGSSTRAITTGTMTWTVTGTNVTGAWSFSTTGMTSNFSGSTILISDTSATAKTFTGGGATYNDFKIAGGGAGVVTITGANTFNRIYTDGGGTKSIVLPGSATTTISSGAGLANGTNVITFTASAGSATISKPSGVVSWNYVNLTNIPSTGGAIFYAGANSTDGGGNTGWIFTVAPNTSGGGVGSSSGAAQVLPIACAIY